MQKSLSRIREEQQRSGDNQGPDISFDLMATAYRRKRLMEGLMSGDRDAQNQILTMATSQLAADDAGAAAAGRLPRDGQRGAKAKSLQAQLAEAGFGPGERAVVKKLAATLPPADLTQNTRDLEKLTRFGFPRLRGLRHAHVDLLVQTVRPLAARSSAPCAGPLAWHARQREPCCGSCVLRLPCTLRRSRLAVDWRCCCVWFGVGGCGCKLWLGQGGVQGVPVRVCRGGCVRVRLTQSAADASRLLQALAPMAGSSVQMVPRTGLAFLREWLRKDARGMHEREPPVTKLLEGSRIRLPPHRTPKLESMALGIRLR